MADDEKKSRTKKMYDHPRSRKDDKPKDSEEKKPKAEAEPKGDGEGGGEKKADEKPKTAAERHAQDREALRKLHETERRDMHGTYRDQFRSMAERHEGAHADMLARHQAEMDAEAAGAGMGAPGVPMAPGAAPAGAPPAGAAPVPPAAAPIEVPPAA